MSNRPTLPGRIIAAHGRHYTVELDDASVRECFPRGKKTTGAVGDRVLVSPEGAEQGAIEKILERKNLLYRSDDMRTKQFAANVDQLIIVVAVEPAFSEDLAGRALVAAWSVGVEPLIVLNKADLKHGLSAAQQRLEGIVRLGVPVIQLSALTAEQVRSTLLPRLAGKTSLLLGQSAMGKSTLLNALVPEANAHTQEHSVALGAGKHTTTSTRLYHLPDRSGDIIDSPGFQAFGLYHLTGDEILRGFPEFESEIHHCRFYNCTHRHEPGCGVLAALHRGEISRERHELYQKILDEKESAKRY